MPHPTRLPDFAIDIQGLHKTYPATRKNPAKHAVRGIDLRVPRGSIFGLLGPNGAGKSTLINILAGVVVKTSGTVRVWDMDIDAEPRNARAALGIVPQEIAADVFFTPFEALEQQAGLYGVPKPERRTAALLGALGLSDKAHAYVRQLSGGMKRRLMVAKAMVHNPPILILDEPTAGVDVELRRQLWDYVRQLHAEGVTIVLTTHYLEEAEALCDQIAIINHGEVVACEPTVQLVGRIDRKSLLITPTTALDTAPVLAGLDTVLRTDGRLQVSFHAGAIAVEDVLAQIKQAGISIRDLATEDPGLEDIFMALTSEATV